MKNIISILLLLILFYSCNSVKFEFVPTDKETLKKISYGLPYLKEDELYLIFKELESKQNIQIYENNLIKHDTILYVSNMLQGVAGVFKIKKDKEVLISFDDISKPILLLPNQMQDYKFIIVHKKNKRVKIEFNNTPKRFFHKPGSIPEGHGYY